MGSAPGDSTKMRGAQQWLSANALDRSKGGGSMNARPSLLVMYSCSMGMICKGTRVRVRESCHLPET